MLARAGATIVEIPHLVQPPSMTLLGATAAGATQTNAGRDDDVTKFERGHGVSDTEFDLLLWEFAQDIETYLLTRRVRAGGGRKADVPRTLE